jgi:hypothetical protein
MAIIEHDEAGHLVKPIYDSLCCAKAQERGSRAENDFDCILHKGSKCASGPRSTVAIPIGRHLEYLSR